MQRAAASHPVALGVARSADAPARLTLLVLGADLALHAAATDEPGIAMLQRAATMALIAAATWLLARVIRGYGQAIIAAHPTTMADNLEARRLHTQTRALTRAAASLVVLVGAALMLMTVPAVRQVGASLLASAGLIGLVAGFAARPLLGNLIAGLQIGLTQPIRIHDVVIVEGEWGVIEEITGAYVVVRIWDDRRLVVPLQHWVEKPFQNWTRRSAELTGTVTLWVDYGMPLAPLRAHLLRTCEASPHWDGRLARLQVVEAGERAMQLRALVTAADASRAWDLRCQVRESLIEFIRERYPQHLPQVRAQARFEREDLAAPSAR